MRKPPFYKSVKYALEGILTCIQNERTIKIHMGMVCLVTIAGIIFSINQFEWIICILLFGFVIGLEMINTAIEAVVDLCSPQFHPLAKVAKDVSAGAVLVASIAAAIIGLLIFIPYIF